MQTRHQQRKHLFLYLEVLDQDSGKMLGHLGDISSQGMMIIAEHPLPLYQTLKLRLNLPDTGEFSKNYLNITVETRWTRPDINPQLHCIGCQFQEVAEDDLPIIEQVGALLSFEQ